MKALLIYFQSFMKKFPFLNNKKEKYNYRYNWAQGYFAYETNGVETTGAI